MKRGGCRNKKNGFEEKQSVCRIESGWCCVR